MRKLMMLLLLFVLGCGGSPKQPTLDCSSVVAYRASLLRIFDSWPEEEVDNFESAIENEMDKYPGKLPPINVIAKPFDGMTGDQIVAKMKEMKEQSTKVPGQPSGSVSIAAKDAHLKIQNAKYFEGGPVPAEKFDQDGRYRFEKFFVSLPIPPGLEVNDDDMAGFASPERNGKEGVVIIKDAESYTQLAPKFKDLKDLNPKHTLWVTGKRLSEEETKVDGHKALLMLSELEWQGSKLKKWVLVLDCGVNPETQTLIIAAQFPEKRETEYSETLKSCLLNAKILGGS